MNQKEIADLFERLGFLFELKGENPFKIRALEQGARLLEQYEGTTTDLLTDLQAKKIKGFGPQLTEYVATLLETGSLPMYETLKEEFPSTLFDLFALQGLGAKKIKVLYEQLNISSVPLLKEACLAQKVSALKGFGAKTEQNLLRAIEHFETYAGLVLYPVAEALGDGLLSWLRQSPYCMNAQLAGSIRRRKEITKDIDIVACSAEAEKLLSHFTAFPGVQTVLGSGGTKASIILETGVQSDLRVVAENQFASALLHFTGSKEHNTQLRALAKKQSLKLNEYGIFSEESALELSSEAEMYTALGLCYVEPELREGLGEIEAAEALFAEQKSFPRLVESGDIKGILHAHSTYSDGKEPLERLAKAVQALGYEYLGISDHSRSAAYAGGLSIEAIRRQHKEIEALNAKLAPFRIFKGIESDILADGSLDYPDEILKTFDFVIASIHSQLGMSEEDMTNRLLKAVENPYTTILGHSSGRLLLRREAYVFNAARVLKRAAETGVCVEINANPRRLDLDWRLVRSAKDLPLSFPICPDAHAIEELDYVRFGVGIARKGGLTPDRVLNSLGGAELDAYFKKRSAAAS